MREDFSILSSELHLKIQVKKYNFHFFPKEATFCENAPKCIISISPNVYVLFILFCPPPAHHVACWSLVPQTGIEPTLPMVEEQNRNHRTAREVPGYFISDLYLGSSLAVSCIRFIISRVCKTSC